MSSKTPNSGTTGALEKNAAAIGADALAQRLRNASEAPLLENPFNFRSAEDRKEYGRLLQAGTTLQPDFMKRQAIYDTADYEKYRAADKTANGRSTRQRVPLNADKRTNKAAIIAFFAAILGLIAVFAVVSLALNRNPFSKTCAPFSPSPSPGKQ